MKGIENAKKQETKQETKQDNKFIAKEETRRMPRLPAGRRGEKNKKTATRAAGKEENAREGTNRPTRQQKNTKETERAGQDVNDKKRTKGKKAKKKQAWALERGTTPQIGERRMHAKEREKGERFRLKTSGKEVTD
jgi:hypothetical protein